MSATETSSTDRAGLVLPACLIIMDGFGLAEPGPGNAISLANTPTLDALFDGKPWTRLAASGEAVGLPAGQMGNSEVGHLNIGAGRVVYQELTRINRACADGSLAENPVLGNAFAVAAQPGATLHLMGLLSDGGVHSSNAHLYALLRAARDAGVSHIVVHCFMDGRDVPPKSGLGYVKELEYEIATIQAEQPASASIPTNYEAGGSANIDSNTDFHMKVDASTGIDAGVNAGEFADACAAQAGFPPACCIKIGSITGRYYAMDRDNRWERVEAAYRAVVCGQDAVEKTPTQVMQESYDTDVTDEFVMPTALTDRGMRDGDAVVFFNFRPDRAREITRAIVDPAFSDFERMRVPQVEFVCLTEYDPEIPAHVAFAKEFPEHVLADVLAEAGLRQYHIAETEKYAHVTFFLNGGREEPKAGEQRTLIPSPKVATYDLQPEMSEPDVAATLAAAIEAGEADVYIVNFANPDMVGHTGVIPAAVAAVEAVDAGVARVLAAVHRAGGVAFVTADHGNADKMIAEDGSPHTAHTTALVPFIFADYANTGRTLTSEQGALCDIAPTLLDVIGLAAPVVMTGKSLLA